MNLWAKYGPLLTPYRGPGPDWRMRRSLIEPEPPYKGVKAKMIRRFKDSKIQRMLVRSTWNDVLQYIEMCDQS